MGVNIADTEEKIAFLKREIEKRRREVSGLEFQLECLDKQIEELEIEMEAEIEVLEVLRPSPAYVETIWQGKLF